MSFRARITIAAALAVAIAVAVASVVAYLAVRSQLRGEVDEALRRPDPGHLADPDQRRPDRPRTSSSSASRGRSSAARAATCRSSARKGAIRAPGDDLALPVDERTREAAARGREAFYSDAEVAGTHVRDPHHADRRRLRRPDRPAAHRGGRLARSAAHDPRPRRARRDRARGGARPRRRAYGARAGSPAHRGDGGGDRDPRPLAPHGRTRAPTSSGAWPPASTPCSPRSRTRRGASAASSPTPRTSCARR